MPLLSFQCCLQYFASLGLWTLHSDLYLCHHMTLWASSSGLSSVYVCVYVSSSYKEKSHLESGPTLMTPSLFIYICKDSVFKPGHAHRPQGFGLQHMFLEVTIQP